MNVLNHEKKLAILSALVEGNSVYDGCPQDDHLALAQGCGR